MHCSVWFHHRVEQYKLGIYNDIFRIRKEKGASLFDWQIQLDTTEEGLVTQQQIQKEAVRLHCSMAVFDNALAVLAGLLVLPAPPNTRYLLPANWQ